MLPEVDIIVKDKNNYYIFIEVKYRKSNKEAPYNPPVNPS